MLEMKEPNPSAGEGGKKQWFSESEMKGGPKRLSQTGIEATQIQYEKPLVPSSLTYFLPFKAFFVTLKHFNIIA